MTSPSSAPRQPRWRLVRSALQQPCAPVPENLQQFDPEEDFAPMPPCVLDANDLPPDFIDELGFSPDPSMPFDDPRARAAAPCPNRLRIGPRVVALDIGQEGSEPPARLRRLPHALLFASKTDLG